MFGLPWPSFLPVSLSLFPWTRAFDVERNNLPDLIRQWWDHTSETRTACTLSSLKTDTYCHKTVYRRAACAAMTVIFPATPTPFPPHHSKCALSLSLSLSDKWKWSRFSGVQRLRGFKLLRLVSCTFLLHPVLLAEFWRDVASSTPPHRSVCEEYSGGLLKAQTLKHDKVPSVVVFTETSLTTAEGTTTPPYWKHHKHCTYQPLEIGV